MSAQDPTRRTVLAGLGSLAVASACAPDSTPPAADDDDSAEPEDPTPAPEPLSGPEPEQAWQPGGALAENRFPFSVQATDPTADSILLSLRTEEPEVRLRLARAVWVDGIEDGEATWEEVYAEEGLRSEDRVVQLEIGSLVPDYTYAYVFTTPDGSRRSRIGRFRTARPDEAEPRLLVFGATSCLGDAGRPWRSLSAAADEALDFFLLLGDTVYADGDDTVEDFRQTWDEALGTSGLADLSASTALVATWDDHEVTNNWSWDDNGRIERYAHALRAFREALPWREGPGGSGLWRALRWGTVAELFVLDCRGERQEGRYVSVEQMEWLKAGLRDSPARFRIILNSVPITDFSGQWAIGELSADDRWQGHPAQRDEILRWIRDEGVPGVLWLSGDFHFGQVARVDAEGGPGAGQWEVMTGPAGSLVNPVAYVASTDEQYRRIVTAYNWVRFACDPETGRVDLWFIGDGGEELATIGFTP